MTRNKDVLKMMEANRKYSDDKKMVSLSRFAFKKPNSKMSDIIDCHRNTFHILKRKLLRDGDAKFVYQISVR